MSNSKNNQTNIPQTREAMDRFKMQAAQKVGVNLTNGYNGQMEKKMCFVRTARFVWKNHIATGCIQYIATITI